MGSDHDLCCGGDLCDRELSAGWKPASKVDRTTGLEIERAVKLLDTSDRIDRTVSLQRRSDCCECSSVDPRTSSLVSTDRKRDDLAAIGPQNWSA